MAYQLDPKFEEYASPLQWEKLVALRDHGSERAAAEALGISRKCFYKAKKAVLKKAAQHGYCPERDLVHPAAPGMSIKGTSLRYNADGKVEQYWNKTKQEGRDPEDTVQLPDPKTITKVSTLYDQEGNVTQQWVAEKPDAIAQANAWEEFAKALAEDLPRVDPIPEPEQHGSDNLMACYPVGDHHLGMLSWGVETGDDYDLKIGEDMLRQATNWLVSGSPACSKAAVVFLGDFMHYDSFEPVTPSSRNQLDADSRFPKMVRVAIRSMRHMIETAARKHDEVHVVVEIGNHDLSSSIFLMECLANIYEDNDRITIDTSPMHYHYFEFGKCLIGVHHGHGTKMQNLPLIMATDRKEAWGRTSYRYWWTGHIHTSKVQAATSAQDFAGCTVESFRILAPPDAWAHQKGYRSHRDMKSIILNKEFGEVARHTVNPEMFKK